jgi:AraC family transcriptional activator of pobA
MGTVTALPLFHLYGDPPDDQAFDFIHVETIASRSSVHDWLIRAHRHRNLFQILVIETGGGDMTFEAATLPFAAPAAILVPPTIAHGFRFIPRQTDGWVVSFTEDVAAALGERSGEALKRLKTLAADPVIPLDGTPQRLSALCADLHEESFLAREGFRLAMRGLLALIAIEVARLAASRARTGAVTLAAADATVEALRKLVDEHFRKERLISFYAGQLAADPRNLARPCVCGPVALRALLPQADRDDAAGIPRGQGRVGPPFVPAQAGTQDFTRERRFGPGFPLARE